MDDCSKATEHMQAGILAGANLQQVVDTQYVAMQGALFAVATVVVR